MNKIMIFSILFILIFGKIDSHLSFCTNEGCKTMKLEHEIYSSNKPYAGTQDLPFVLNEDPKKFVVLLLLNTTDPIDCPLGDLCNNLSSVNEALPPNLFDASNLTDLVEAKIDPYQYIRSATSSNETGQIWKPFTDFKLGDFHKKQLPHMIWPLQSPWQQTNSGTKARKQNRKKIRVYPDSLFAVENWLELSDLAALLLMTLAAMVFDHFWALIFIVCFIELVIFEKHHKIQAKRYKEANKEIINIRENRCSKYTNKLQQHTVKNTAKTEDDNRTSTLKTTQKNEAKENAQLNILDSTKSVEIIHETDNAVLSKILSKKPEILPKEPVISKVTESQEDTRLLQQDEVQTKKIENNTKISNKCDSSVNDLKSTATIKILSRKPEIIPKELVISEVTESQEDTRLLQQDEVQKTKIENNTKISNKLYTSVNELKSTATLKILSRKPEILPKEPVISEVTESQEDTRLLQQDEVQKNKIENNTKISNKLDTSVNELKSTATIKILSRKPEILPKEPVISEMTDSQEDTRLLQQDEVQKNKIENNTKISNKCDRSVNELKSTATIKILSRKPEILPKEPVISEVTESQEDTRLLQQDEVQKNKIENNTKISNKLDTSVNKLKSTATIKILSRKPEILPKEPLISKITESQEDTRLLQQDDVQTNKIENNTTISNKCDSSVNELKSTARIKILSRNKSKQLSDQMKRKGSSTTKKINFLTQSEKEKKSIGYGWLHKKLFQRKKQKSTKRKSILSEMMKINFLSTNPLVDGEDLMIYLKGNTFSIIFENDENDSKCESVAINEIPVNNKNLVTTLSSNMTDGKNQAKLTTSSPCQKQEISNSNESFRTAGDKKVTQIESIQKSKEKKVCLDIQKSFDEETSKLNLKETNTTPNSYKSLSQPPSTISITSKPKNHENVLDESRSADCNILPHIKHHKTNLNDKCGKQNKDYNKNHTFFQQQKTGAELNHQYNKARRDYFQKDPKHYNQQRNESKTQHHYSKTNKDYIQQDSKHYNQQRNESKTQHHYSKTNKYSYQQNYKHQQKHTYRDYTDSSIAPNHISYKKHTGFSKFSNKCKNYLQTPLTINGREAIGSTIRKQKPLFFNPSF